MATLKRRPRAGKPSPGQRLTRERAIAREISDLLGRLRTEIKTREFTQNVVAAALGWAPSTLSDVLRGQTSVPLDRVLLICRVIGLPSKELFLNREPTAEQQLQRLLKTRGHFGKVLGRVDEAALMSATRSLLAAAEKRPQVLSTPERDYLNKVVQWCETSIALDQRARRRRAGHRAREQGREPGPVYKEHLVWPDFKEGDKH